MYEGIPKGPPNRMAPKMEIKQTEELRYLGELINSLLLLDHPKIINQHDSVIIAGDGATWQKNVPHL